jgi:ribose transport system ATP-binding protein
MAISAPALDIASISKAFAGQLALDRANLRVEFGEIHALVGQNGSGKSTLVKILAGFHDADGASEAYVDGQPFELGSAQAARTAGIRFVHQDLGLVLSASTVDNLALGAGYDCARGWRIRWRRERRLAAERLSEVGLDIDVRKPVSELSVAERTGVAIARAMRDAEGAMRVLILDEPSAALAADDAQRLFVSLRRLRDRGVAVVFVSHHLDEVLEVADRVTVLRDGRTVVTAPVAELNDELLIELMLGHALGSHAKSDASVARGDGLVLESVSGSSVADVSFTVDAGEIVGVGGIRGSGADAIASLVVGRWPRSGRVRVDGVEVGAGSPGAALGAGMAFVSGDRALGIIREMTVYENVTLGGLSRHVRGGVLRRSRERAETREWLTSLAVVSGGTDASVTTLSGGNQQKLLIARALRLSPKVLVLDDPTRGVDVGAKDEIHALLERIAADGTAILLASTDAEELARVCDRVWVMQNGVVVECLDRAQLTAEAIEHAQIAPHTASML